MYEHYYRLREKPFSLLPDPSFLYLGRQHSMAYTMLEYGVLSQAGFTVITGDIGCGKTTLIRHLLNQLDANVTVGLVSNTANTTHNLRKWVLLAFRQDYKKNEDVELHEALEDFLIEEYAKGRRTVLIVDEAQNFEIATLEELRMLSNINADKDLVLQLILVGQRELKGKLEHPELRQFAQRVAVSYHLGPLTEPETLDYIRHRLHHAGGDPRLFSAAACRRVFEHTGGVPRLINLLCDTALVYGYAEQVTEIGESLLRDVVKDRSTGLRVNREEPKTAVTATEKNTHGGNPKITNFDREQAKELFSSLSRK